MADIKHTPLPWVATKEPIAGIARPNRPGHSIDTILEVQAFSSLDLEDDIANRDFILKACNSYYANQETIRELREALQTISAIASTMQHSNTCESEIQAAVEVALNRISGDQS